MIDTVPGRKDYTPLWGFRLVTWKEGADASFAPPRRSVRFGGRGDLSIRAKPIVVNCPVL